MLVAREKEAKLLRSALEDEYSQFIAVYGRRRVGKTFLVRESFGYDFTFQHAGLADGGLRDQLFAIRGDTPMDKHQPSRRRREKMRKAEH